MPNIGFDLLQEGTQSSEGHETIEIELCDFNTDFEGFEGTENDDCLSSPRLVEVEILDPLNPQSNAKDHVEIIDSEGDNYVKHLELEICSLKREVFFLKDEYQKIKAEMRNLKDTIKRSEEQLAEKQLQGVYKAVVDLESTCTASDVLRPTTSTADRRQLLAELHVSGAGSLKNQRTRATWNTTHPGSNSKDPILKTMQCQQISRI
ncbi:GD14322 [Drosophila simulans]|uniref:GD14322 n=1 Tax=Drosophila simulans TaxID=7240 RepID=B4QQ97_DROSI|nr:GD14322 [Drosophila simulans]